MYEKYEHWQGCPEVAVKKELKGKHKVVLKITTAPI